MEVDLQDTQSKSLEKATIEALLNRLSDAADEAGELRDIEFVQSSELREAMNIVEEFLRKRKRVCYGGMAINAHLPASQRFYDLHKTLPDYDFFTPDPEADTEELGRALKAGGFDPVVTRLGMHEGTYKIFVNFNSVADLTLMPNWIFQILQKRALVSDGIYYADSDFLRMAMYLELSRPRGEVERWEKVYKRLLLLNMAKPPNMTKCYADKRNHLKRIDKDIHRFLLKYIADQELIFAGGELKRIYNTPNSAKAGFVLNSQNPVLAFAEHPEVHIPLLREVLSEVNPHSKIQVVRWHGDGDKAPEMVGLTQGGRLILVLIAELYCHGYNEVELPEGKPLRIASLDTAITLYYQLTYVRGMDGIVPSSVYCFANSLVEISRKTRDKGKPGVFPMVATSCQGHQPSKASLLKAKAERVASHKRKTRKIKKKTS